ncbi:MAG TPA: pitrilysin family protein, partial [Gemmatimonadales bacterium]|nr:pitrilysin family protein [Gemmatimonadales bacterium]
PNGLRVLLFPDESQPKVTVALTIFVGSRHEGYGETGMAHLLEHMVFKGTPDNPDIPAAFKERGAQFNGTTSNDRTNYFETFPAGNDNLRWALDLEADRMVNSYIAAKDLASEMTVVRNEFESGENDPRGVLMERVFSTAYLWHNYGKSTIGARSDIENVPIERLQGFYRKYYQPDNSMLVVAGKFDPDTALAIIAEKFGSLPRPDRSGANRIWETYTLDPVQDGERSVLLRRTGDIKSVMAAWHVPHGSHPDFAAIDLLGHVLGASATGRLYTALVTPGLAAQASAFSFQLREPGLFMASAMVEKEKDVYVARDAMFRAIDSMIGSAPATEAEVNRARAVRLNQIQRQLTNPNSVGLAMSEWAAMGDWRLLFLHRDRLRSVTVDDVNRVARTYLKESNRTTGVFIPDAAPDRVELPPGPDVLAMLDGYTGDTAMAAGEDFDPTPANLDARTTRTVLPSGVKLAYLPRETRGGMVAVRFSLRFGTEQALMNRGAVPSLTGAMLMRGTERLSRQELRDEMERLETTMGIGGGAASLSGSVVAKRERLADVLRLAAEVMRQPRFDAAELEVLKREQIAALESQRSEPQVLAMMTVQRHLSPWPKGHPNYVSTLDEQIELINAVTVEDLRRFHAEFYGASNGEIAVVGAFDPEEVTGILDETLGGWESRQPYRRIASPVGNSAPLDVTIETPDKANAMVVAMRSLPIRDDSPEYPAMMLADFMLGGGVLNSRLMMRLRQQDGLSYGAQSFFGGSAQDSTSMWGGLAIYAPQNDEKVMTGFREVLEAAARDGFTDEEIAKAKEGWLESQKLLRSTDAAIANSLVGQLFLGRSFAQSEEMERRVAALNSAELKAVVARYLDPDSLAWVRAGDFNPKPPEAAVP